MKQTSQSWIIIWIYSLSFQWHLFSFVYEDYEGCVQTLGPKFTECVVFQVEFFFLQERRKGTRKEDREKEKE